LALNANAPEAAHRGASGWLFLHCFAGPCIGTCVLTGFSLANNVAADPSSLLQAQPRDLALIPVALLLFLLPGWFLGFIPALAHAVAMLLLRRIVPSQLLWLSLTPLVGWVAVFVPALAIVGVETFDRIFDTAMLALVGSAAAIGCMAIAWRRSMYPVELAEKIAPAR